MAHILKRSAMRFVRILLMAAAVWLCQSPGAQAQVVTNLHPAGAVLSFAFGVQNGQQVGASIISGVQHASLWSGTAASRVDLNPAGATNSSAFGIDNTQQVGAANVGVLQRVSLWSGTAASWVDLHPAGKTDSIAVAIHNGQQVGSVGFGPICLLKKSA
jgi:hypothetical protein